MKRCSNYFFLVVLFCSTILAQQNSTRKPDALMLRFPDVSTDKIVFVYSGDIWTVSKDGGVASRLSTAKGMEYFPKFSPDGKSIAFTGNYDGNMDVYIMPSVGGVPKRLTHNPMVDFVVGWYPDGKNILYRSGMYSPSNRFNRLFKESIEEGLPEQLPMKIAEIGSFNADASKIVFETASLEFRTWKRYRGGWASKLWIYDLKNNTSEQITFDNAVDALPMWHGNTIYFLSDRDDNKKHNIWAYDVDTKQFREITHFTDYDIKWPSLGPNDIVFEKGGEIFLLDLVTEKSRPVDIEVPADLPQDRPQLKNLSGLVNNFSLSPSGKRALFCARGEILTVPEKNGSIQNLTNTSGIAERFPSWSPDGKYVAYFSDKTGEYELYIRPGDGSGEEKQITKDGHCFRYNPEWSPNSKSIAFSDKTGSIYIVNIDDGETKLVDKNEWDFHLHYNWSPDSKFLAYDKGISELSSGVFIYDIKEEKIYPVTTGYYNSTSPVFDPGGKYLYYYSNDQFHPVYGDMDATWIYPNSTSIVAVTLQKDGLSPLIPQNDMEEVKADTSKKNDESDKSKKADDKKGKSDDGAKPVKIDFENIEQRSVKLPVEVGNVGPLHAVEGKVVYQKEPSAGDAKPGAPTGTVYYYDLKDRESKEIISGINTYDISADGKKIIYKSGFIYGIIDLAAGKKVGDGKINTDNLETWINPREEWTEMFNDAWRIERDYFYDPGMHGVDWKAIKDRYAALLPFIIDRNDLNYIIGEMIGELNSSHTYVGGGDVEQPKTINVGLLGCDYEIANGYYRFKKIYKGGSWDNLEITSPLLEPGNDVKEGDYLIAVNGLPLDIKEDPWAAFQGLADQTITLTINSKPNFEGARKILVKPLSSEARLRNLAWIEENRDKVDKETGGKAGYVYVPNTGMDGQSELVRQYTAQYTKDAMIIDERFNSGGQIPDRFVELLNRPVLSYWARRDFKSTQTPFIACPGPKVMLINGWSGSGGDAFPYYFKEEKIGPLVGKRTWGGLIGYGDNPQLVDGGFLSAPSFGIWDTAGNWTVEGYGVDPDYEVTENPAELAKGNDEQLEKAIEVINENLKEHPVKKLQKPHYPDKSK
jgi:tricorn protease